MLATLSYGIVPLRNGYNCPLRAQVVPNMGDMWIGPWAIFAQYVDRTFAFLTFYGNIFNNSSLDQNEFCIYFSSSLNPRRRKYSHSLFT